MTDQHALHILNYSNN